MAHNVFGVAEVAGRSESIWTKINGVGNPVLHHWDFFRLNLVYSIDVPSESPLGRFYFDVV